MALINCSECGGQVNDKASTCPKCGAPSQIQGVVSGKTQGVAVSSKSGLSIIHWIGIVTAGSLLGLCSLVDRPGSGITSSPTVRSDASSMAHVQCMEFVKTRLKSPSSASFSYLDRVTTKLPDHQYIIRAAVEAKNAFGVNLNSNYVCNIKWNGQNDADIANWTLVSLEMDQ